MRNHDGLFSMRFGKRKWWGYDWTQVVQDHLLIITRLRPLRSFSSYSCMRKLATIQCLVLAATPPYIHTLPLCFDSLDTVGNGIAESLWLTDYYKYSCRYRWDWCRWCHWTQVGVRWRPWPLLCFLSRWSVVVPSRVDRDLAWVVVFYSFDFVHTRTLCSSWMIV